MLSVAQYETISCVLICQSLALHSIGIVRIQRVLKAKISVNKTS